MSAALEISQVSKSYGEGAATVRALDGVDLTVLPGELVAIMGPSGSGKSTMLTIAGTLEEPTEGTVCVDGQDTSTMSRNDRARLRRRAIGYVFQDFNLLPGLTVAENVALPLELDGTSREGCREPRRSRRSRSSVCPIGPTAFPTSSPVASASVSRSPAPSSVTAACFSPTSPPARSTRSTARR